ncbi:Uncharacterized protein MSYG_1163 [Malassezia sympodialis ATCC 42132]|uniref:Uncharacterized protein n=1 Tax=Malassezia sympodialis (strain ATCC 42132) TaxID=1230383 RepID=A0A1M8A3R0_MALS4|nr:Uncharacterized protein MSYG_1163 [Malassezia sympodialis ATCC 42132]
MNVQLDRNQPRTPATDSRALQNLIKAEKEYVDDLLNATSSAFSAASSLHAWGLSETPDLGQATGHVSRMLENVVHAQKTYAYSLNQYRESLKDMLDREQSIRSIVRDRDILMNRVIKSSQRKPTRWEMMKGEEEYQARIFDAQRELQACEQTLANEMASLVGVKRRTFKEALMMRAKTLGDMGAQMTDCARQILVYLDQFDADIPVAPMPISSMEIPEPEPMSPSVFVPPSRSSQNVFLPDEEPATMQAPPHEPPAWHGSLPPLPVGDSDVGAEPMAPVDEPRMPRASSRQRVSRSNSASEAMSTPRPSSKKVQRRTSSIMSYGTPMSVPTVPGGVPSAPQMNLAHARDGFVAPTIPGGVPTAPRLYMHDAGAADADDASTVDSSVVYRPSARHGRSHSVDDEAFRGSSRHSRQGSGTSFLSKMSGLFKTDMRSPTGPQRISSQRGGGSDAGWGSSQVSRRHRAYRDDSSDDEPIGGANVVRHVNERVSHGRGSTSWHPKTAEEQALDEAIRRSVMGEGIAPAKNRPSTRQSDEYGIRLGPPSQSMVNSRMTRSTSLDYADAVTLRPDPAGVRKVKKRSSSEQVGGSAKTKGKKKKDPAAHPPPAPSSFYTAKSPAASLPVRPSSVSSASRQGTPLKSAMKGHGTPSSTHKRLHIAGSDTGHTLTMDDQVDGTGHLDLDLPELGLSKDASMAPALSYLGPVVQSSQAPASGLGGEAAATYLSFVASEGASEPAAPAVSRERAPAPASEPVPAVASEPPVMASAVPAVTATLLSQRPARPPRAKVPRKKSATPAPAPAGEVFIDDDDASEVGVERRATSWSTRIGRADSSDEEGEVDGDDDGAYISARKKFGSATRHLGEATGAIPPKVKGEQRAKAQGM